jgi:S1-C subfamily serine protease
MPRVLGFVVVLCVAVLAAGQGRAEPPIFGPFEPGPLNASERRLLQTALAATDDYRGPLDGIWGPESRSALEAYARREFEATAQNAHVAALVLGFLDEVSASGWDFRYLPELGVSLALPFGLLGAPEPEEGGERRWSHDGSLTVLTQRFDHQGARLWHDAARRASGGPAPTSVRSATLLVTRGLLRDGRAFFTRSDRTAEGWGTVFVAADAAAAGAMNLVAGSVRPGEPLAWDLPEGGRLDLLVSETAAWLGDGAGATLAALPAPAAGLPLLAGEATGTGTGFYLGARTIVTAEHVVAGCGRILLADGAELTLIAADPELDVAALAAAAPSGHWLSLAEGRLRLGQRVHAAGFPYYSIAGTSLNLTSGNVSALAGVDDDRRFFGFSAPVQPGNSGGPLVDSSGAVRGLVVARLSEDFIVETTGSLPQNVNYALREAELAAFLDRAGVRAGPGGLARFDMDEGAPDAFAEAVVPIVCE